VPLIVKSHLFAAYLVEQKVTLIKCTRDSLLSCQWQNGLRPSGARGVSMSCCDAQNASWLNDGYLSHCCYTLCIQENQHKPY